MTNLERKNAWERVGWITRQAERLEQQLAEAPADREEEATERYQRKTTLNQIELFDRLDQLLLDSGYKKKGKRQ